MNYRKQAISFRREAEVHQNILLALITTIVVLLCVLIGSSIAASGQSKAAQNTSYKYYTSVEIEKGDTIWNIAEEYMTPEYGSIQGYVEEIKSVNNLGDDDIHSGQYLMIPYFSSERK